MKTKGDIYFIKCYAERGEIETFRIGGILTTDRDETIYVDDYYSGTRSFRTDDELISIDRAEELIRLHFEMLADKLISELNNKYK